MAKKFKWTVEFTVDEKWVADGFEVTHDRALDILAHALPYAHISTELAAKVVKAPIRAEVLKAQGYSDDEVRTMTAARSTARKRA